MKTQTLIAALVSALVMGSAGIAEAGFVVDAAPANKAPVSAAPPPGAAEETGITMVGLDRPDAQPVASGLGRDQPLQGAMAQILPKGWTAEFKPASLGEAKSTWRGGLPWPAVAKEAHRSAGLTNITISVDEKGQKILVAKNLPVPAAVAQPASGAPVVPAVPEIQSWAIEASDGRVSKSLRRWCETAGYTLVWDADRDFAPPATATYKGSFRDAVSGLMVSLRKSDYPLQARFPAANGGKPVLRIIRYTRIKEVQ